MTDMDCNHLQDLLATAVAAGWSCTPAAEGSLFVAAPLTYPDGDHPEMLVSAAAGGRVTVSDFGSARARLRLAGLNPDRGRPDTTISAVARSYGIATVEGELRLDVPAAAAGRAMFDLAAAMIRIDGLSILAIERSTTRFRNTLREFLVGALPVVDLNAKLTGGTGKPYRIDAAVPSESGTVYVQAISNAHSTQEDRINSVFRTWSDVNGVVDLGSKVSVLAGEPNSYELVDLRLLEGVSIVGTWSERESVLDYLKAPRTPEDHRLYAPELSLLDS